MNARRRLQDKWRDSDHHQGSKGGLQDQDDQDISSIVHDFESSGGSGMMEGSQQDMRDEMDQVTGGGGPHQIPNLMVLPDLVHTHQMQQHHPLPSISLPPPPHDVNGPMFMGEIHTPTHLPHHSHLIDHDSSMADQIVPNSSSREQGGQDDHPLPAMSDLVNSAGGVSNLSGDGADVNQCSDHSGAGAAAMSTYNHMVEQLQSNQQPPPLHHHHHHHNQPVYSLTSL